MEFLALFATMILLTLKLTKYPNIHFGWVFLPVGFVAAVYTIIFAIAAATWGVALLGIGLAGGAM